MENTDLFELIVLTFFIHFLIFAFLEIVFVIIFEKLRFKKISDFLDKHFMFVIASLSGIFTILSLFKYFQKMKI